ncbi:hypothetical protein JOF29_000068 [Kribbella aluminosa]|uniref:DUF2933 domain-containing protein n=1 Tax=Kribbella aluminosa TaxID=416017 RepID=A0ABS4UBG4_9ACTN|nr:DUF2933 domain-containing protein [Kribbella aluminosa]MBP2348985.1 hypothetical protein [Kribbella aluminosa]
MKELLYSLPLLACPLGMGLMMWFMMRGKKEGQAQNGAPRSAADVAADAQIASLRAELDQLQAGQRDRERPADRTTGPASTRPL